MESRFATAPPGGSFLLAAVVGGVLAHADARAQQTSPAGADTLEAIVVTGSRIKRLDGETALPVTTITRADIAEAGATTAAELMKTISASTAPLSDGMSITDGTSGQRGFNGANLRGIGVSSTLVLLNGRRLANFASPGDNAGVDLNNIPAGAIERVEVLKDGASAIYGTDAIGGVINFITRRDYEGVDVGLSYADTEQGGADKQTATLSAGYGNLEDQRFNVFGVVDWQNLGALRSSQRDFIQERPLAQFLPALMSSNTYPANVDINAAQRNALIAAGLLPAGTTRNRINPSFPACNPPATVNAPQGPGGPVACSYDYMRDTEIYPDSEKLGFLGRATVQLGENHRAYAEAMYSESVTTYVLSPNPNSQIRNLPISVLPQAYRTALSAPGLPATFSRLRFRTTEAGNRTNEVTSEARRLVVGFEGKLGAWDYDAAVSRPENRAVDKYVDGYVLFNEFEAGIRAGTINPFGPSSAAGLTLIQSLKVNDEARKSKGVTDQVDASISRSLMTMGGGDLGLALGAEFRQEDQRFDPSALLLSNNIAGDRSSTGSNRGVQPTRGDRDVFSAYVELNAPFTPELEVQLAVRFDDYSEVGSSTNPKLGVRWQPTEQLLFRGSVGTGFRAPSLSDLNRPTIFGTASSFLTDPQCVAAGNTIDFCTDQWPVERRSNPDLKPEESRQFSAGVVYEPSRAFNASLDYWNIRIDDVISTLGEQIIVESPQKYNGRYIQRNSFGDITNIVLQKENQGELETDGLDVGVEVTGPETSFGRFGFDLQGTYVLTYDRQFGPLEPFRSNLGIFLNDQVIQRWRHRASVSWDLGPMGLTLANTFSSGYRDQNTTYDPFANARLPERRVASYSLWDLTGSWQVTDALQARAGVLNLLDADPPFSNQAYYFLAGYDPTYTDPRGRSGYVSVNYKFR
ncbi:MAG: TonB-dependent receptor [Pseudomonadota bacterium]